MTDVDIMIKQKTALTAARNFIKKQNLNNPHLTGAIWNLSTNHEDILDEYEGTNYNPPYYYKEYFTWKGKKVLVYIQKIYTKRKPSSSYLHTIIEGYKNCDLDLNYLKKRINNYSLDYSVHW